MLRRLLPILILFFSLAAHGGTCPSGANYLSTSNPTGPLVTLSSLGITSCFYIASNGSDSNDGASEASGHPWLHAPGMPNCSNTCGSHTPAAGEGFIFRGGDTWHMGNSGLSPYTGGQWAWQWSGSGTGSPIYVGVDTSWFSGGSWVRPILNADNPTSTSIETSCAHQVATNISANTLVYLTSVRFMTFDNFELSGLCWKDTTSDNSFIHYTGAVTGVNAGWYIQNLYLHGWTYTSAGTQGGGTGFQSYNQNFGAVMRFNIIDGQDSEYHSLQPWGQGADGYDLEYNVTRYAGGTSVFDECHIFHDNLFEFMSNVTDGSTHTDVYFCFGEFAGGASSPNVFYNNIFRNIGTLDSATISYNFTLDTPSGQTDYVFNNVFHDFYGGNSGFNYNAVCDPGSGCGTISMWNNTAEAALPNYNCCVWNQASGQITSSINDHFIAAGSGPASVFKTTGGLTETTSVYQTIATANGQGYTSANDFAPTASSNTTVTTSGTNETSANCASSVLHNAAAQTACTLGTTNGCSYNATSHTISCPNVTANARPSSGSWNVGAYQFANPPTITLSPSTVVNHNVIPLGLNYNEDPFDMNQVFKNLVAVGMNAGCGANYAHQIIHATAGSATSFTGENQFDQVPANFWSTGFTTNYAVRYSKNGSAAGKTGTISSNTATGGTAKVVYTVPTISPASFNADDYIEIWQDRSPSPSTDIGHNQRGNMYSSTTGTGSVSGSSDVPADFMGNQSCDLNAGTGSATMQLFFGSNTNGGGYVLLENGETYQLDYEQKSISGSPVVTSSVNSQDSAFSSITHSCTITGSWAHCTSTFSGPQTTSGNYPNGENLQVTVTGGEAHVTNVSLQKTTHQDSTNKTQFRDEFLKVFRDSYFAGSMRALDDQWAGVPMPDWLYALPTERRPVFTFQSGTYPGSDNAGSNLYTTLPQMLDACLFTKVKVCWLTNPVTLNQAQSQEIQDFLDCNITSTTTGGTLCTTEISRGTISLQSGQSYLNLANSAGMILIFEFSNETWNTGNFGGNYYYESTATGNHGLDPYATVAQTWASAMQGEASYATGCNGGSCSTTEYWGFGVSVGDTNYSAGASAICTACAYIFEAPYPMQWGSTNYGSGSFPRPQDISVFAGIYADTTQCNGTNYRSTYATFTAGTGTCQAGGTVSQHLAIYENNYSEFQAGTTITQASINGFDNGGYAGLMMALQGIRLQQADWGGGSLPTPVNLFTFGQYQRNLSSGVNAFGWGIVNAFGVNTQTATAGNNFRPTFIAAAMLNQCMNREAMTDEFQLTDANFPTTSYSASTGGNSVPNVSSYPYIYNAGYRGHSNQNNQCLAILNADPVNSYTINLSGLPSGILRQCIYNPPSGTTTNETANNVTYSCSLISSPSSVTLSADEMMTLATPPAAVRSLGITLAKGQMLKR